MEQRSLVSILIPVYNRVGLVGEAIRSALGQTYSNIEVIVSDNCSTDGTWELLQELAVEDPRLIIVRTQCNLGPVPNWQNCLDRARGEYVKFLFSDDWMRADCVELMVNRLLDCPTCDVVISSVMERSAGVETISFDLYAVCGSEKYVKYPDAVMALVDFSLPLSPGAALYRKQAVRIHGLLGVSELDSFYKKGIGPDLLLYAYGVGQKGCAVLPQFVNTFRRHSGSLSMEHSTILFRGYWLFLKYYLKSVDPGLINAVTRGIMSYRVRILLRRIVLKIGFLCK